jgi:hypothetical protein
MSIIDVSFGHSEIRSRSKEVREQKVIKDKNPHPYETRLALWNVMRGG